MTEALAANAPRLLSILRIISGLLFLQHGMAKIIGFPAVPMFANLKVMSLVGVAGLMELIGGILLIIGLWTRPVAFLLSGLMAFAYFLGHMFRDGNAVFHPLLNGGTLAALYCFTFLYLATAGAGPWSLDASMKKN